MYVRKGNVSGVENGAGQRQTNVRRVHAHNAGRAEFTYEVFMLIEINYSVKKLIGNQKSQKRRGVLFILKSNCIFSLF